MVTNLIVSTKFLHEHPDLVKYWIRAQVDLTDWIRSHPPEAKKLVKNLGSCTASTPVAQAQPAGR